MLTGAPEWLSLRVFHSDLQVISDRRSTCGVRDQGLVKLVELVNLQNAGNRNNWWNWLVGSCRRGIEGVTSGSIALFAPKIGRRGLELVRVSFEEFESWF